MSDQLIRDELITMMFAGKPRGLLLLFVCFFRSPPPALQQKHFGQTHPAHAAAGSDTTANTLSFLMYRLALDPPLHRRARQEIRDAMQQAGVGSVAALTYEQVSKIPLLAALINETLRLYPSAPDLARGVARDVVVDGKLLRGGSYVVTSVYNMHRWVLASTQWARSSSDLYRSTPLSQP